MQRQIFETEHNLFRDAFRAFLDKEVVPHQDAWEEAGVVDRAVWRKAGEMGFLLPWADEEYGGAGLKDFRYEQIMCEELARINEPGFMIPLHSALCGPYIAEYGSAEQKARLLPGIVRGETILAVAMTEPSAGSDLAGMRSTAVDKGDHWLLNGSKVFISNGLLADLVIVAAKTDPANKHAMGLFLVERGMQGFERGRNLKKLGMKSQDTAELFFNNVRVPKENLLGDAKGGFFYLMNMLAQERLTNACGAVAGAEAALQATIDYVEERQAFGHPGGALPEHPLQARRNAYPDRRGAGLHRSLRDGPQPEEAVPRGRRRSQAVHHRAAGQGGRRRCATAWRLGLHVGVSDLQDVRQRPHPADLRRYLGDHERDHQPRHEALTPRPCRAARRVDRLLGRRSRPMPGDPEEGA